MAILRQLASRSTTADTFQDFKSISSVTKDDYSLATKLQIIGVLAGLIVFVLQVFRVAKFLTREHLINAAWGGSAVVAKVLSPCW
jgi:hypothetical protein